MALLCVDSFACGKVILFSMPMMFTVLFRAIWTFSLKRSFLFRMTPRYLTIRSVSSKDEWVSKKFRFAREPHELTLIVVHADVRFCTPLFDVNGSIPKVPEGISGLPVAAKDHCVIRKQCEDAISWGGEVDIQEKELRAQNASLGD